MPYIAIKTIPKDEKTKRNAVEQIEKIVLDTWGCPPEAITISVEEVTSDEFRTKIREQEVIAKMDKVRTGKLPSRTTGI